MSLILNIACCLYQGTALSGGIVINGFFTDINPLTYTATLQVSLSGNGTYVDEEGYLAFNTDLFAESNRQPILNYNYTGESPLCWLSDH